MRPNSEILLTELLCSVNRHTKVLKLAPTRYFHISYKQWSKSDYEWIKSVGLKDSEKSSANRRKEHRDNEANQHDTKTPIFDTEEAFNQFKSFDQAGEDWKDYSEMFESISQGHREGQKMDSPNSNTRSPPFYQSNQTKQHFSPSQHAMKQHPQAQASSNNSRWIEQEMDLPTHEQQVEELIMNQTKQMIEHDLERDIMNELYVVSDAQSLVQQTKETILTDNTKYGMITGRMGRRDELTPSTKNELIQKHLETRNNPIVLELVSATVQPERVIELVDQLRDEIRLEYLSQEQYQAIFQKHIKAWLQLDNAQEAQESFCRYFESWYRLQVQMGAIPYLGRPHMNNKELYMKLAMALAEAGELHMVQKLVQGFWHDYGSHLMLYEDTLILLHSVMIAYVKRGQYTELLNFFVEKFDTSFGRLPVEYTDTSSLTPPSEETFRIIFDTFFVDQPKHISAEELTHLLLSYRDEVRHSSEEKVREWGHKLMHHLIVKEEKFEVAQELFIQLFQSPLNYYHSVAILPHLYDYQYMLELYAEVGEVRLFDSIFHALLTDENIGNISDAFYALRVKVFSMLSLQEGLNKLNTHFSSEILQEYSNLNQLSKRAFYDPSRKTHYIALVAISDAAEREGKLEVAWKCIQAYESDCMVYTKEVHQYLYTNIIRIQLSLNMQDEALSVFKHHFRSPLFASEEDTTEYGLFEDVDEVCILLIESFLKSGDIDMAVRLLEIMKSPPENLKNHMNLMRKRLEEV